MGHELLAYVMPYAYWFQATDPATGMAVPGLGAHRFYRFLDEVALEKCVIRRPAAARGGRPDQIEISAYRGKEPNGEILFSGRAQWNGDVCEIDLGGVRAFAVSQCCGRTTPSLVNTAAEYHATEWTVPFTVFDETTWYGDDGDPRAPVPGPEVNPPLRRDEIAPSGTRGLTAWCDGRYVHYESRFLKVSFNLIRPAVKYLSWDHFGDGGTAKNFLVDHQPQFGSGPWCQNLAGPGSPFLWGGEVSVNGRQVVYRNLHYDDTFTLNATFTVHERGMDLRLNLEIAKPQTFLEFEPWRFVFDGRTAYSISTLALPLRGEHRNGLIEARGGWHASGHGTLTFEADRPHVTLQVDNLGFSGHRLFGGFQVGVEHTPFGPVTTVPGTHEANISMRVTTVAPALRKGVSGVHRGLLRAWGTPLAFRPEHGGFSNNSFSVNCHNCQHLIADFVGATDMPEPVPGMLDLFKYNIELALRGGPGYSSKYEYMDDTVPSLLISAGTIAEQSTDNDWVRRNWPCLRTMVEFMLGNIDETGMYTSPNRDGNSYGFEGCSIAWDTFHFGHYNGYSAALAFKAFGLMAPAVLAVGDPDLSRQCADAARRIKDVYYRHLFNPETGWLAGWRSADGELHDHGYVFVNAAAAVFGLLTDAQARAIMTRIEVKREEMGLTDFRYGMAAMLLPVPQKDWSGRAFIGAGYNLHPFRRDGADTFGVYTNGCLSPALKGVYIEALAKYGFRESADRVCDDLLQSFDRMLFDGCRNGTEFFTWDGTPCGYEGSLSHCYHVLLAIARHKGWLTPEPAAEESRS